MHKYEIILYWSNEDQAFVAEVPQGSVDVLVNDRRQDYSLSIPHGDAGTNGDVKVDPDDIRFNNCRPTILARDNEGNPYRSSNPDHGYSNYRLLLHEAGHALGLSGYDPPLSWLSNLPDHPTIPDSVMYYDSAVAQITSEPDCSPHPFDIMAIYALYGR